MDIAIVIRPMLFGTTGVGDARYSYERSNVFLVRTSSRRVIRKVSDELRMTKREKGTQKALMAYFGGLEAHNGEIEENIPQILVFRNCEFVSRALV